MKTLNVHDRLQATIIVDRLNKIEEQSCIERGVEYHQLYRYCTGGFYVYRESCQAFVFFCGSLSKAYFLDHRDVVNNEVFDGYDDFDYDDYDILDSEQKCFI